MSLGTVGGHQHQARVARLESRNRGFRVADRGPASRHREQPDLPGRCALLRVLSTPFENWFCCTSRDGYDTHMAR
jgi:hypothetical protein